LHDALFKGEKFKQPKSKYLLGLESAPEAERYQLWQCESLMEAIAEKTQHLERGAMKWKSKVIRRIAPWLVYTLKDKDGIEECDRALFTAEKGNLGDLAAIYKNSWVSIVQEKRICQTHILRLSCKGASLFIGFDGTPRRVNAEQKTLKRGLWDATSIQFAMRPGSVQDE
jgi:hypothetical protein